MGRVDNLEDAKDEVEGRSGSFWPILAYSAVGSRRRLMLLMQ